MLSSRFGRERDVAGVRAVGVVGVASAVGAVGVASAVGEVGVASAVGATRLDDVVREDGVAVPRETQVTTLTD